MSNCYSGYSISQMIEYTFLEELDDPNIKVAFENAVSVSIAYTLMKRMGIDVTNHFEHEDFLPIFDFNTIAVSLWIDSFLYGKYQRFIDFFI